MQTTNGILTGTELMALKDDPDNYLIEGLLWENNNVMILAREKVGKSIFTLQMACSLSCGEAFLGEYEIPEPMSVLYIQTESTRHETIQRLRAMTHEHGVGWNPDNFNLLTTHSLALDSQQGMKMLMDLINSKNLRPRVIFLDPLYMSMEGSLNDDLKCRSMSKNLRLLGQMFNASVVVVHHEHRQKRNNTGGYIEEGDNSVMGSFVWKAFPNHIIRLQMTPDKRRILSCDTQRSAKVIENMKLELVSPLPLMYKISETADKPAYVDNVFNWVNNKGKKSAQEISDETGISLSAVKKSLAYLTKPKVNKLYKLNPGQRPTYYKSTLGDPLIPIPGND